jgi:PKD repeat protein
VEHSAAGVYVDFLVASVAEVGDNLRHIDLSYPNVTHRTWTFSDGFSSSEQFFYHAFYLPGDRVITLTAGNEQCTSQRSKLVSIVEKGTITEENKSSNGNNSDSTQVLLPENPLQPGQTTAKYVEIVTSVKAS